ncbi:MAG: PKD domain-containing protein [candidate division Zixibacteria bacterium]|nr:PKD domain-containing protein [candidate division Zixibacteria bacterium]
MKAVRFLSIATICVVVLLPVLASAQSLIAVPECVTYDSVRDRYFVSNATNGRVIQIDSNGVESIFWTSPGYAMSSHIKDNRFYISTEFTPAAVVILDLETGTLIKRIVVTGSAQLDGMTTDTSGNLYVVDANLRCVYKIDLDDDSYFKLAMVSLSPQDIYFDASRNRLLVAGYTANARVEAVSLPAGIVTTVVQTPFGWIDGIACDNQGRYYFSCGTEGNIYRYDSTLTNPPVCISTGHSQPSNIGYDLEHDILMVPNFNGARVDFIGTNADFTVDTRYGNLPLNVNFSGTSINHPSVDAWNWRFDDGGTATGQNASHTFTTRGMHEVDLNITVGSETFLRRKKSFICALADTSVAGQINAPIGSKISIPLYAGGTVYLNRMVVPMTYSGLVNLKFDSFSTAGCLTNDFPTKYLSLNDSTARQLCLILEGGQLVPGRNMIAKVYFSIISGTTGQETILSLDGFGENLPSFAGSGISYTPDLAPGKVKIFVCGDANGSGITNIADVTFIINFLYKGGPPPVPPASGDLNKSGNINIQDVTYLINYLYKSGPAPNCPAV